LIGASCGSESARKSRPFEFHDLVQLKEPRREAKAARITCGAFGL